MDSVNKDHKKMFKKSITYSKPNKNNDKLINFKLDSIPENCYSLWFIINAYNGDSLKHIDKAMFTMYPGKKYYIMFLIKYKTENVTVFRYDSLTFTRFYMQKMNLKCI